MDTNNKTQDTTAEDHELHIFYCDEKQVTGLPHTKTDSLPPGFTYMRFVGGGPRGIPPEVANFGRIIVKGLVTGGPLYVKEVKV